MVSNIQTGGPGASGGCWNFLVDGCFFEEPGSTTLYYKACTKHFPVLLCTTKLAQSNSQYNLVLQSLHNVLPSTTVYYKACTKHFRVLRCTTKLAQSTPQHYFVLQSLQLAQSNSPYYFVQQSLHKVLPSTTLYYKACTKHFLILLFWYYFLLQSLRKVLASTTLYYKACTKYSPVLLCTTKLAQSTSQYYLVLQSLHKALPSIYYFVLQSLRTSKLLHKEGFTQRNFQVHNGNRNCSSKTGSRRQSEKNIF